MKVVIDGKRVDGGSGGGGGGGGATYPYPTNTIPKVDSGSGNVGSETTQFARGDHVHPTDTTRASVSSIRYNVATNSSTTLKDRTINRYVASQENVTFTFETPPSSTSEKALDLIVDIDNTDPSVGEIHISFSGYGYNFWLATTDEDISVPLTIEQGKYVRCYITQTSFKVLTDPDSLPVLQISTQEVFIPTPGLETVVTFTDDSVQVINTSGTLDTQALIDAGIYE